MATLTFDGSNDFGVFTPISSALGALSNGAGTIAILARVGNNNSNKKGVQLVDSGDNAFHGLGFGGTTGEIQDDSGLGSINYSSSVATATASADNFRILVEDWPSGGAGTTGRSHVSALISAAESWSHLTSNNTFGGNQAGPGTSGLLYIGAYNSGFDFWLGEIALVGIWAGIRFADSDAEALWVNKKTSDWYNHSAGTPTFLVECTSTTLTDIGANPSTFSSVSGATATGADPTGWDFDGQGAAEPSTQRQYSWHFG